MRALVVEEEQNILRTATRFLRDEGYFVDTAENGEYGKFRGINWDYDLILLDVALPRCDGWSVLAELRRHKKNTPVLMLTTSGDSKDRLRQLNSEPVDFLAKPLRRSDFVARVRSIVRNPVGRVQSVIEIGPISIDTTAKTVAVNHCGISLTAKEYCLLEFLAMHRGKLVTRTEIYDHLFDEFDSSPSNLLDVYVCKLRRKVGRSFITTRRAIGYIIEA
jgi:two-component system OmpR family response regulator